MFGKFKSIFSAFHYIIEILDESDNFLFPLSIIDLIHSRYFKNNILIMK